MLLRLNRVKYFAEGVLDVTGTLLGNSEPLRISHMTGIHSLEPVIVSIALTRRRVSEDNEVDMLEYVA